MLNITIDILQIDDRNFFNFTWNVTKYADMYMDLQLTFHDAYYITVDHYINVLVNQTGFFVSNETLRTILDPNRKMGIKCSPQI